MLDRNLLDYNSFEPVEVEFQPLKEIQQISETLEHQVKYFGV